MTSAMASTFATQFNINADLASLNHWFNQGSPGAVVVPGPAPSLTDAQINAQLQAANPNVPISPVAYNAPAAASTLNGLPSFLQGEFTIGGKQVAKVWVYGGSALLALLLLSKR